MIRLVPDPNDSEVQYCRYYHLDVASLDDTDILDEFRALAPLLWWKLPDDDWLRERVRILGIELAKRRSGKRQGVRQ